MRIKKRNFITLGLLLLTGLLTVQARKVWDIKDYGAKGDSLFLNTEAIQQAIDACHDGGGGEVLVNHGVYISGTLFLKSKVYLKIEKGAKLVGSANPMDYQDMDPFVDATGQTRGKCLIGALDAQDIGIIGEGVIDGVGEEFVGARIKKLKGLEGVSDKELNALIANRPFLIRLVRTKGIVFKDIQLRQAAAWMLHLYQCENARIEGISIYNHANRNNDGIDVDSSKDIVITDSQIDTGDDAICLKTTSPMPTERVKVRGCRLKSDWGAFKIGTESMGDVRQVSVKDCYIYDTRGGGIKILSVDGANISDVHLDRIQMENVEMPIFVRLGERLRTYRDAVPRPVGSIDRVTISRVKATTRAIDSSRVSPPSGIWLTGTPSHKLGHIALSSIQIRVPGGGADSLNHRQIEEQIDRYPEFSFFGPLPAYGLMARHVETLSLKKIVVNTIQPDRRKERVLEDVQTVKGE